MTAVSLVLSILRAIRRAKRLFLVLLRAAPKHDFLNSTVVFIMCVGLLGPMTLLGWTSNLFKIIFPQQCSHFRSNCNAKGENKRKELIKWLELNQAYVTGFCVICFLFFDQLEDKILDFVTFRSEFWTDTS